MIRSWMRGLSGGGMPRLPFDVPNAISDTQNANLPPCYCDLQTRKAISVLAIVILGVVAVNRQVPQTLNAQTPRLRKQLLASIRPRHP